MHSLTGGRCQFAACRDQVPEVAIGQLQQGSKPACKGGIQVGFVTLEKRSQYYVVFKHATTAMPFQA